MANTLTPSDLGGSLPIDYRVYSISQVAPGESGHKDSPAAHNVSVDGMENESHIDDNWSQTALNGGSFGDVKSPQNYATPGKSNCQNHSPTTFKKLSQFVRHHEFFSQLSLMPFTTSDRRKFERDIYDFGRSLGLSRTQAKEELVKARQFCGERDYESDNSAWADEVNDSLATLGRLSTEILEKNKVRVNGASGFLEGQNVVPVPDAADGSKVEKAENLGSDAMKAEVGTKTSLSGPAMGSTIQAEIGEGKKRKPLEIDNQKRSAKPVLKKRKRVASQTPNAGSIPKPEVQSHNPKIKKTRTSSRPAASKEKLNAAQSEQDSGIPTSVNTQLTTRVGVNPAPLPTHSVKRKPARPRKKKNESSNLKSKEAGIEAASTDIVGQPSEENLKRPSNVEAEVETLEGMPPEKTGIAYSQIAEQAAIEDKEKQVKQKQLNGKKTQAKQSQNIADEVLQKKKVDNTKKGGNEGSSSQELQDEPIRNKAKENVSKISVTAADEGLSTKVEAPAVEECNDASNILDPPRTPEHNRQISSISDDSSPLSSALSSPEFPSEYTELHNADNCRLKTSEESGSPIQNKKRSKYVGEVSELGPPRKPRSSTISPYFLKSPTKKAKGKKISCIPFPPLDATSFGLVQETLCHEPFRLLIAVIFLNKTRGSVAMPVFYDLIACYPTPADLAAAKHQEIVSVFQHLGLQNQRAIRCINLAKTWLETPPAKGKRYRRLHYPNKDDGKDIDINEGSIADDDDRIAWEVGHLLGIGSYAIDSWRIFCRDELRGLPTGLPARQDLLQDPAVREAELAKEWTRVLPLDKELRAYLRWRWLRLGFEWDPLTGRRDVAAESVLANVLGGGVVCEDESGRVLDSPSAGEPRLQDLLRGSEAPQGESLDGGMKVEGWEEDGDLVKADDDVVGNDTVEIGPVQLEPVMHGDSDFIAVE